MRWKRNRRTSQAETELAARLASLETHMKEFESRSLDAIRDVRTASDLRLMEIENLLASQQREAVVELGKLRVLAEGVNGTLRRDSRWVQAPPEGLYAERLEDAEGAIFIPLDPAYEVALWISNPLHVDHSATYLIMPKRYAHTECVTLTDGSCILALLITWDDAPPGWRDALEALINQRDEEIWLEVQRAERGMEHEGQIVIEMYRFIRDPELEQRQGWSGKTPLLFDRRQGFRRRIQRYSVRVDAASAENEFLPEHVTP